MSFKNWSTARPDSTPDKADIASAPAAPAQKPAAVTVSVEPAAK